jgi:hypothetical protein
VAKQKLNSFPVRPITIARPARLTALCYSARRECNHSKTSLLE